MCWRSLTAHRLLGWILQALAFGSLQPSRAETYRDSRGALDDYRFTSGLKMYENTNCFNHRGGFRVSDDTNPVQHRTPQECKRLCLDHPDCEGFEVVSRHLSEGHPPEGPCWLRKHLDVRDCWAGEHGQGWSLFVVAGRYGGSGGGGGGGVLGDGEYVVVRDGRTGTRGKKKKKKAPPPKALTVSGLAGPARWGNGEYKRLGKACGGGVYWQKRGDDAYVYVPRGRETWYLGDRLCSTVDYWSRCRGNATDVARCTWESREGKGYGEKIKVKAGKDKKKEWYMSPVIHDDYGPPLILVLVLAVLLLCTCCAVTALALRPRGQQSRRAVVVVEEKPYEAQPEHDTEVLVIEQKDERACGGCW